MKENPDKFKGENFITKKEVEFRFANKEVEKQFFESLEEKKENPLLEQVERLEEAGIEKPHSVYMSAMLAARGEPYCTMLDLSLFANAMDELLK